MKHDQHETELTATVESIFADRFGDVQGTVKVTEFCTECQTTIEEAVIHFDQTNPALSALAEAHNERVTFSVRDVEVEGDWKKGKLGFLLELTVECTCHDHTAPVRINQFAP